MVSESNRRKLENLIAELNRTRRDDEPDASERHLWVPVTDMDTNKVHWKRKDLYFEFQELRFTSKWHDED